MSFPEIDALTFDVFGTVADWKGTIVAEGRRISGSRGASTHWESLADAWRIAYGEYVNGFLDGKVPYRNLDVVLLEAFDPLIPRFGLEALTTEERHELGTVWSRLRPLPDAAPGFARLHGRYTLAALTNANVLMLEALARSTALPWDRLLSAELAGTFKTAPAVYTMALAQLGKAPSRVMMVASHTADLDAAHAQGFRTALIARAGEPGSDPKGLDHQPDIIANDLDEFSKTLTGSV